MIPILFIFSLFHLEVLTQTNKFLNVEIHVSNYSLLTGFQQEQFSVNSTDNSTLLSYELAMAKASPPAYQNQSVVYYRPATANIGCYDRINSCQCSTIFGQLSYKVTPRCKCDPPVSFGVYDEAIAYLRPQLLASIRNYPTKDEYRKQMSNLTSEQCDVCSSLNLACPSGVDSFNFDEFYNSLSFSLKSSFSHPSYWTTLLGCLDADNTLQGLFILAYNGQIVFKDKAKQLSLFFGDVDQQKWIIYPTYLLSRWAVNGTHDGPLISGLSTVLSGSCLRSFEILDSSADIV